MTAVLEEDTAEAPVRRHGAAVWVAALLAPLVVVGAVIALVVSLAGDDAEDLQRHAAVGLAAAPLDLDSVTPEIATHYTFAEAHHDEYVQIPCYCGCEEFLDHRNLYDCFVRADGNGWDAHAAGCGVCIGESSTARRLVRAGEDPAAVRDAVVEQFGSTPATTPPS